MAEVESQVMIDTDYNMNSGPIKEKTLSVFCNFLLFRVNLQEFACSANGEQYFSGNFNDFFSPFLE